MSENRIAHKEVKDIPIDMDRVISHLSTAFANATHGMGRPSRLAEKDSPSRNLFNLQVTFCYYLDSIMRGPKYIAPKIITECNNFISNIK